MRLLTVFTAVAITLCSCKTKLQDVEPPEGILDKEEMVAVLVDIHLAESYGYMLRLNEDQKIDFERDEYAKVFKLHHLTLEHFEKSYQWYIDHPVVFDLMYDKVIEGINLQEQYAPQYIIEGDSAKKETTVEPQ